jgi:hypothetical protein
MTKQAAIAIFCKDCAGGSSKEVNLCHLYDCPLWPWRTGAHISTKDYSERITVALKNYPEEVAELSKLGIDTSRFIPFLAEKPQRAGRADKNSDQLDTEPGELA